MEAGETRSLPENAYRPLNPGEVYAPMIPASSTGEEASGRSIGWGLFLCVLFTVAAAYSGRRQRLGSQTRRRTRHALRNQKC